MRRLAYKVFWEEHAARDLEELVRFMSADSPLSARKWLKAFKKRAHSLRSDPFRGRLVPELAEAAKSEYRELIISPYRLIFTIKKREVYVLALFDGRRDLERILLQRVMRSSQ